MQITWPHQLHIGRRCRLEPDIFFKFDGVWQPPLPGIVIGDNVFIGRGCEFNVRVGVRVGDGALVASGCKLIDHDHDIPSDDRPQGGVGREEPIDIGDNAWLGANVVVLRGISVGRGAIVAAGAVVTKSVPAFEIWAGVPARRIGRRPSASVT